LLVLGPFDAADAAHALADFGTSRRPRLAREPSPFYCRAFHDDSGKPCLESNEPSSQAAPDGAGSVADRPAGPGAVLDAAVLSV